MLLSFRNREMLYQGGTTYLLHLPLIFGKFLFSQQETLLFPKINFRAATRYYSYWLARFSLTSNYRVSLLFCDVNYYTYIYKVTRTQLLYWKIGDLSCPQSWAQNLNEFISFEKILFGDELSMVKTSTSRRLVFNNFLPV